MDTLAEPGGQVAAMYPEKEIFDIAGLPAVRGRSLVEQLVEQARPFDPRYMFGERATTLDYGADGIPVVRSASGIAVRAGAVVITGGIGSFTPRPLGIGGEFDGRGLRYFVPRPADHALRDVVIVGGGDSAFDWAASLEPLANSVTLVHRRERFRAHAATVHRVRESSVRMILNAQLSAVRGNGWIGEVEVTEKHGDTVHTHTLPAQDVIAALGFVTRLGPLLDWGLNVSARRVTVDTTMATNRPRVFAAGDIVDYPGKVRLISVGFGEVATAVNNAATVIDPESEVFPGHSTEKEDGQ